MLSPLLVLVTLLPFAVMLSTALKPHDEVLAFPPRWLPTRLAWENFCRHVGGGGFRHRR